MAIANLSITRVVKNLKLEARANKIVAGCSRGQVHQGSFQTKPRSGESMREDPGASCIQFIKRVRQRVTATDNGTCLEDSQKLSVQGYIPHWFDNWAYSIRAQALWEMPERVMNFVLKAVQDTLAHNANLHLWKKLPDPNCPGPLL